MNSKSLWLLACVLAPLAGGCGAMDKAVTRNFYHQASRQRNLTSTLTISRVVNNEPPLVLDETFAGEVTGPASRVKADYQAGLEGQARTLAAFLEEVLSRTERELGLRLAAGVRLYVLNVDRPPRSLQARLTMKDGAMPYPVFIPKGQAGRSPITQPLLDDLYSLLHEVVELALCWPGGPGRVRALADVETMGGLYRVRNHTRWFRDGYANYAAYVGLHEAREAAGEQWPKWLSVNSMVHERPFSALAEVGRGLFRWDQFSTGDQQRRYEAALGLFLLIERRHGRDAIRRIMVAASQLEYADGPALVATCSRVLGTDVRKMAEDFQFPNLGLELQPCGDNRGDGPDGLRWAVLVTGARAGGAGARAGFRKGDVIVRVNGRRVENVLDLELALMERPVAGTVELEVERNRKPRTITLRTDTPRKRGKS